jgi:hypothetical protein
LYTIMTALADIQELHYLEVICRNNDRYVNAYFLRLSI